MFLIIYSIISPMDEQLGHNLSILGTLMYAIFPLKRFKLSLEKIVSSFVTLFFPQYTLCCSLQVIFEAKVVSFQHISVLLDMRMSCI